MFCHRQQSWLVFKPRTVINRVSDDLHTNYRALNVGEEKLQGDGSESSILPRILIFFVLDPGPSPSPTPPSNIPQKRPRR
jgi:hypothetical protein